MLLVKAEEAWSCSKSTPHTIPVIRGQSNFNRGGLFSSRAHCHHQPVTIPPIISPGWLFLSSGVGRVAAVVADRRTVFGGGSSSGNTTTPESIFKNAMQAMGYTDTSDGCRTPLVDWVSNVSSRIHSMVSWRWQINFLRLCPGGWRRTLEP